MEVCGIGLPWERRGDGSVCEVEVSRERAWYSCVECIKGFVIFELLVINLLEEL